MMRVEVIDIIRRVPAELLSKTVLTLRGNIAISLDQLVMELDTYMVCRGREAGTNDEGRAFFISYDDLLMIKIDRVLKLEDIREMYKANVPADIETPAPLAVEKSAMIPAPEIQLGPQDPAAIAKQNLLARIRAARTASVSLGG